MVYGDVVKDGNVKKAPESYYLYHRMIFCHQCVFTRRDSLISTPFDIKHRLSADFKSFIELYRKGARFRYVNLPIAIFDTGGVSNSHRSKGLRDNISVVWGDDSHAAATEIHHAPRSALSDVQAEREMKYYELTS